MPLSEIQGPEAFGHRDAKREPAWPAGAEAANSVGPVAVPAFNPTFAIIPGEAHFTMGSCLVHSVEHKFDRPGFDVPLSRVVMPSNRPEVWSR